ncbi:hypothetical protein PM082_013531 [Marasmius tenuissimus]|nr:hypothetical protein PM082_013531 [Marasmius tenuissimus]
MSMQGRATTRKGISPAITINRYQSERCTGRSDHSSYKNVRVDIVDNEVANVLHRALAIECKRFTGIVGSGSFVLCREQWGDHDVLEALKSA